MKNIKKILCVVSVFLVAGCNMFRPDTRADLTRYEVFVEVDGKPYKITRTIQNWITYGFDTNQGSSQGRRSDYGTFGQKIHGNQAIVLQFGGHRTAKPKDWIKDKNGKYILNDPEHLKNEFKILLLDHYKNPQIIEMYDRKEAFESPNARVKVMGKTWKKIPKIPFWLFQGDGKDRYYDYDLKYRSSASENSKKHFETRTYFISKLTDAVIEQIISEYPQLEPHGVYRLKDGYEGAKRVGISGGRISSIIGQSNLCSQKYTEKRCRSFIAEKQNNEWIFVKRKYPIKVYLDTTPRTPYNYYDQEDKVRLNGQMITIRNRPKYRNQFINFDTKEYYGFSWGYYSTREHKPK